MTCYVKVIAEGKEVWVEVEDNGHGIAPGDVEHVFDKIVQAHGSRVWVENKLGKGTTFYVALPFNAKVRGG